MMKTPWMKIGLAASALALIAAAPAAKTPSAPDITIIHAQVILDHLGFSPGVIDGKTGATLTLALSGFQKVNNLPASGKLDKPTLAALARYRATRPLRLVPLTSADLAGPFLGVVPSDPAEQAKLPALGYANALERLAERFHTTPETIRALNPVGRVPVGTRLRLPNVVSPPGAYPAKLPADWQATLAELNVGPSQPQGKKVVVDKSDGALRVYDAGDRLIAQFPATMGSEHDPLPIGKWTIKGAAYNPSFHYNPELFWDADSTDTKQRIPAGPNGPVGVVWLDLSKPHYGIHGTPNPEKIGRSESHGCIRLTNWDVARLSLMVAPGTPAIFQP